MGDSCTGMDYELSGHIIGIYRKKRERGGRWGGEGGKRDGEK